VGNECCCGTYIPSAAKCNIFNPGALIKSDRRGHCVSRTENKTAPHTPEKDITQTPDAQTMKTELCFVVMLINEITPQ